MLSMASSPDLLQGLLDDSLVGFLDDLLDDHGQANTVDTVNRANTLSFGDPFQNHVPLDSRHRSPQGKTNQDAQRNKGSDDGELQNPKGLGTSHRDEVPTRQDPPQEPTSKKQKTYQEKNKRAQRRYRERKKALFETQQKRIEELTEQLQELQVSEEQLRSRCSLLEKVASMQGDSSSAAGGLGGRPVAEEPIPECVTATATLLGLIYPGQGVENRVTIEHVEQMTIQDYIKVFKDFDGRFLRLMAATDGRDDCPVRREVEQMIEARRWSVRKVMERNPGRIMRIGAQVRTQKIIHGLDWERSGTEPDRQRRVLEAMDLTSEQKARVVTNRRRLLAGLEQLIRRQNTAVEVLQQSMPLQYNDASASMGFLRAMLATQDMSRGLSNYHGVVRDFMSELLEEVLTLWQEAKCMVAAHPGYPDPLAISNILAEELGDDSANARLLLDQGPQLSAASAEADAAQRPLLLQLICSASEAG